MAVSQQNTGAQAFSRRRRSLVTGCAFMALAGSMRGRLAWGQDFPNRPVKLLVGFSAGGGLDMIAREMQPELSRLLGQPVVIENKAGAGGALAATVAARSAPDGYTLVMTVPGSTSIARLLHGDKLQYQPDSDLVPVGMIGYTPLVFLSAADSPIKSMEDVERLAKSSPGGLNVASPGAGTPAHFAIELYRTESGLPLTHVPFGGSGQAISALVGGHVPLMVTTITSAMALASSGRVTLLALTGRQPLEELPDVPLLTIKGEPVDIVGWTALHVPRGTPAPVIERLNHDLNEVLAMSAFRRRMQSTQFVVTPSTSQDVSRFIAKEKVRLEEVASKAHLQFQ
ncbi:extra-cytoplasmic solute receptor family protein 83 [Achromobacter xylosoxidans A8]|uniref:Extra-cytoplasmic solute receptor family protein 83 n=1 Tax=Achromobacter xylosoxidans (strain A8) TaxID=762376 RepID=E3HNL4_ACHXA|nr:tripartite tricarboxylate transporter substrate binding protein [Achromobacter xylosoxidans]ADP17053.1 extra-cytoplasmic solute receptor family protein 83 [Achromobacter xylosoxidans A8]